MALYPVWNHFLHYFHGGHLKFDPGFSDAFQLAQAGAYQKVRLQKNRFENQSNFSGKLLRMYCMALPLMVIGMYGDISDSYSFVEVGGGVGKFKVENLNFSHRKT